MHQGVTQGRAQDTQRRKEEEQLTRIRQKLVVGRGAGQGQRQVLKSRDKLCWVASYFYGLPARCPIQLVPRMCVFRAEDTSLGLTSIRRNDDKSSSHFPVEHQPALPLCPRTKGKCPLDTFPPTSVLSTVFYLKRLQLTLFSLHAIILEVPI